MDKTHKQVGPLSLDELKQQGITRETPVWREGMPNWVQAKDIPELYECITPPKPQISVVQIVLILYATLGTILFLLAGDLFRRLSPRGLTFTHTFRVLSSSSSGYWVSSFPCFTKKENTY